MMTNKERAALLSGIRLQTTKPNTLAAKIRDLKVFFQTESSVPPGIRSIALNHIAQIEVYVRQQETASNEIRTRVDELMELSKVLTDLANKVDSRDSVWEV
jgi:molybdopterin-biosynthesis enzyme MoeA-like protein